ncbi:hypothetical protein Skr01_54570 [Sphaerisporangium krabiense]|nr:hypothetical protein Skr01_54570 [Sphaerisporangium krabiense]
MEHTKDDLTPGYRPGMADLPDEEMTKNPALWDAERPETVPRE